MPLGTRFDNWGTQRASIDVQQPLFKDKLALRFNAVRGHHDNWHQRYDTELKGYAASLRWRIGRKTEIAVMGERGFQDRGIGHLSLTDMTAAYIRGTGTVALDANPNLAGVQNDGVGMFRTQAAGNVQRWNLIGGTFYNLESTTTATFRNSRVREGNAADNVNTNPNRVPRRPISESIVARDTDWGGPQQSAHPNWSTYTVELKHEFSEKFNVLLAHNHQRDRTTRDLVYQGNNQDTFGGRGVFIDVMPSLPNPNGTATLVPNPRYEQYYTTHERGPVADGHDITAHRGVAVYDLRLPWGISQRLVGSATYRTEKFFRNAYAETLTAAEIARRGLTGAAANLNNNLVYRYHYLADGNSDATLTESLIPDVTQLTRNNLNGTTARFDQTLTTVAANALGSYFKGKLRTNLGISRDRFHQKSGTTGTLPNGELSFLDASGALLPSDRTDYPVFEFSKQWATNQTYGAVYHVTPWLSLTGAHLQSSQFTDNLFININGAPLGPLEGKGNDFGARLNFWDGKVTVSYTHYETIGTNFRVAVGNAIRDELNLVLPVEQRISVSGGNNDSRSRKTTGDEVEIFFSPTRNWTGRIAYSTADVVNYESYPLLSAAIANAKVAAQARGIDPIAATQQSEELIADDLAAAGTARSTVSFTTRYSLSEGALKGLALGLSGRFARGTPRVAQIINNVVVLPAGLTADDYVINPFVSYRRKFGRVAWTGQINVNNVFDRVTEQGTAYRFARYTNPRQIIFTNTFSF